EPVTAGSADISVAGRRPALDADVALIGPGGPLDADVSLDHPRPALHADLPVDRPPARAGDSRVPLDHLPERGLRPTNEPCGDDQAEADAPTHDILLCDPSAESTCGFHRPAGRSATRSGPRWARIVAAVAPFGQGQSADGPASVIDRPGG